MNISAGYLHIIVSSDTFNRWQTAAYHSHDDDDHCYLITVSPAVSCSCRSWVTSSSRPGWWTRLSPGSGQSCSYTGSHCSCWAWQTYCPWCCHLILTRCKCSRCSTCVTLSWYHVLLGADTDMTSRFDGGLRTEWLPGPGWRAAEWEGGPRRGRDIFMGTRGQPGLLRSPTQEQYLIFVRTRGCWNRFYDLQMMQSYSRYKSRPPGWSCHH